MMRLTELIPIKEDARDFERIERAIIKAFRDLIYQPLLDSFTDGERITNANYGALIEAIRSGRVTFNRGVFAGRFSASVTRELKALGAEWVDGVFYLRKIHLPDSVIVAITTSEARFVAEAAKIDERLRQFKPEKFAGKIRTAAMFDKAIYKTSKAVAETLKGLQVSPTLSKEATRKVAVEWEGNLQKWIKDFTAEEIVRLRREIRAHVEKGGRFEAIRALVEQSYGVSERKAHFLARQETSLLMSKFKEARYTEANVHEYKWKCVAGSPAHPVRPSHKILDGKVFRWDAPPVTTPPGQPTRRNNPGEDFNCRCYAIPVVRFSSADSEQTGERGAG